MMRAHVAAEVSQLSYKSFDVYPVPELKLNTAGAEYNRSAVLAFPWSGPEIPAAASVHDTCPTSDEQKMETQAHPFLLTDTDPETSSLFELGHSRSTKVTRGQNVLRTQSRVEP